MISVSVYGGRLKLIFLDPAGPVPGLPPRPALRRLRPRSPAARPPGILHIPLHQPPEGSLPSPRWLLHNLGPQAVFHRMLVPLRRWRLAPKQTADVRLLGRGPPLQLHRGPHGLSSLLRRLRIRPHTSLLLHRVHDHPAGPPLCA